MERNKKWILKQKQKTLNQQDFHKRVDETFKPLISLKSDNLNQQLIFRHQ